MHRKRGLIYCHWRIPTELMHPASQQVHHYDNLIFVSNEVKLKWEKLNSSIVDKSFYIPNCCEEHLVNELVDKPKSEVMNDIGFSSEHFNVVYIASIQYRKGYDLLIEQIPEIVKQIPEIRFHFIGKKIIPFLNQIKAAIKEYEIGWK